MGTKHHIPFLDLKSLDTPYRDELKATVCAVIDSGRYIGGPEVESFEHTLATATGTQYAVGVSNGLDALRLSLRAAIELGYIHRGDGIIVAANTYIASILAITDNDLRPILVEPSPDTYNLDTSLINEAIAHAAVHGITVSAIMPVHLYGRTCWDAALAKAVERHRLFVIEDNAQAIGAQSEIPGISGTHVTGGLGHIGAFSFYPTKNIGAIGDAGAIATNDERLAQSVRALANYGSDRRYHNIICGYNCRLDTIQAAILSVRLKYLGEITAQRQANARALDHALLSCDTIIRPEMPSYAPSHVWHQYVVRVKPRPDDSDASLDKRRTQMRHALETLAGITTDIHYETPPHLQPCYVSTLEHAPLTQTIRLAASVFSLPIAAALPLESLKALAKVLSQC